MQSILVLILCNIQAACSYFPSIRSTKIKNDTIEIYWEMKISGDSICEITELGCFSTSCIYNVQNIQTPKSSSLNIYITFKGKGYTLPIEMRLIEYATPLLQAIEPGIVRGKYSARIKGNPMSFSAIYDPSFTYEMYNHSKNINKWNLEKYKYKFIE